MNTFEYWVTAALGGGVIVFLLLGGVHGFAVCDTTGKKYSHSTHLPGEVVRGALKWGWELRTSSSSSDGDKEDDIPLVRHCWYIKLFLLWLCITSLGWNWSALHCGC